MKKEERIYRNSETSEKALERRLVKKAQALGWMAVKQCDVMNSGLPDRLIVTKDGKTLWVEVKSLGKRPTPLQESQIRKLRSLGHLVFVVDSEESLQEVISYLELLRL